MPYFLRKGSPGFGWLANGTIQSIRARVSEEWPYGPAGRNDPAGARLHPSPSLQRPGGLGDGCRRAPAGRSEEHTSELQSLTNLVCRLLLEKKKKKTKHINQREK